jgi:acyl-CoA synthetase (AMP-forming)/AMP-acid ligase II
MVNYSTVVDVLRDRAITQPNQLAYTFLADGETESERITYQELDTQAKAIAVQLLSLVNSGDRALLVYPYNDGIEFIAAFLGCLYAGVIAVTDYPRRHLSSLSQYQARIVDSQAAIALTTREFSDRVKSQLITNPGLAVKLTSLTWMATDGVDLKLAENWQPPQIDPDTLAFLQYTSGSTGSPKGVMVSHGNILHNSEVIQQSFQNHRDSKVLMWLPMFHDMGLIGGVMQPLYLGSSAIFMSPIALAQKPFLWLQAISHYRATTSGGPNFAYDLCCHKVTEEQRASLDLSCWQVAFSGAEPVRAETLENFARLYSPYGFNYRAFYPCYGMAEATLFITGGDARKPPQTIYVDGHALTEDRIVTVDKQQDNAKSFVSCGHTWLGDKIKIVNTSIRDDEVSSPSLSVNPESLRECSSDRVGEIWVMGNGIGKGYWNKSEQTEHTFQARLPDTPGNFLRTGDLGFIKAGELYITGRIKDIMILVGRNHYPQHIEATVETAHPALRLNHGAAFSIEVNGEEQLIIAQEVNRTHLRNLNVEEAIAAIRQAVAEQNMANVYGVALLKTGTIPKTSSGKIQRRACQSKYLDRTLEIVGQWQQEQPKQTNISDLASRFFGD